LDFGMDRTYVSPTPGNSGEPVGSGELATISSRITLPESDELTHVGRAAVDYVARWRWPLMVGAEAPSRRESHGLGVDGGVLEPTTDARRVRDWWTRWPYAGIVAAAGAAFDVVTIPVRAGHTVLEQLTERGAWLGAVMSDDDTVALLVRMGQGPLWANLVTGRGDGYTYCGAGRLVVLPPGSPHGGQGVRWVVPPTAANVPHLPRFEELSQLIVGTVAPRRSGRSR
jgi:hypothetical protein